MIEHEALKGGCTWAEGEVEEVLAGVEMGAGGEERRAWIGLEM